MQFQFATILSIMLTGAMAIPTTDNEVQVMSTRRDLATYQGTLHQDVALCGWSCAFTAAKDGYCLYQAISAENWAAAFACIAKDKTAICGCVDCLGDSVEAWVKVHGGC